MRPIPLLLAGLFFLWGISLQAQQVYPQIITQLPDSVKESSGLEVSGGNDFWTHNDSGGGACLYQFDTTGTLLKRLQLMGADAIDYEDLARDDSNHLYIGDFGNNLNMRTDLVIYKIENPDTMTADSAGVESIYFHYPDQSQFPPSASMLNFDCEAMFHYGDSLYLFSKNRGISTYCRMYRLPDLPGNYTAELIDSFNTQHWITSADISPTGSHVTLLSEDHIWLFGNYSNNGFFGGTALHLSMDASQKEAVLFASDSILYLTEDIESGTAGNLYRLNITPWLSSKEESAFHEKHFLIYPNPCRDLLRIASLYPFSVKVNFRICDATGRTILKNAVVNEFIQSSFEIDVSLWTPGIYLIMIQDEAGYGEDGYRVLVW